MPRNAITLWPMAVRTDFDETITRDVSNFATRVSSVELAVALFNDNEFMDPAAVMGLEAWFRFEGDGPDEWRWQGKDEQTGGRTYARTGQRFVPRLTVTATQRRVLEVRVRFYHTGTVRSSVTVNADTI